MLVDSIFEVNRKLFPFFISYPSRPSPAVLYAKFLSEKNEYLKEELKKQFLKSIVHVFWLAKVNRPGLVRDVAPYVFFKGEIAHHN